MSGIAEKQYMVRKMAAQKDGAAVTFTLTSPGTEDPEAGTWSSGSTSTVTGYASRVRGDAERYQALDLTESEAPTLDFTPDTRGEVPALNSAVSWGGVTYVVRDVNADAPDGTANGCSVVVSRG
jgi:hypothetical protein